MACRMCQTANICSMPLTCGEHLLRKGAEKTGRKAISMRVAMLTSQPKPFMKGRRKCHYCGHCGDGCDVNAMFSSIASTLPIAAATGRLTLRPNSIVRHIVTDNNTGKARGVAFVDRATRQENEAYAKVIIVAASTLESTRILLNSKSRQHPQAWEIVQECSVTISWTTSAVSEHQVSSLFSPDAILLMKTVRPQGSSFPASAISTLRRDIQDSCAAMALSVVRGFLCFPAWRVT
jgi:ferredoxin